MKWRDSLVVLALAGTPALAQVDQGGPPPSEGPSGSSQQAPGQERYDEVGYAGVFGGSGFSAAHRSLPVGSFVEVTSLDSGKTVVLAVIDAASGRSSIDVSEQAAQALGGSGGYVPVRVRKVTPSAQDQGALRQGQAAGSRLDAPKPLIAALRRKLPAMPSGPAVAARPAGDPAPVPVERPRYDDPGTGVSYAPPSAAGSGYSTPRAGNRPPPTYRRPAAGPSSTQPLDSGPAYAAPQPAYSPPPAPARAPARPAASMGRGYFVQVAALSNAQRAQGLANAVGGFVKPGGGVYRVQIGPFPDTGSADRARAEAARQGYPDSRIFTQ